MNIDTEEHKIEEGLKEEATKFYNLVKEWRRERYLKEESEAYVLNKLWLSKWKEYVNYSFVKKNLQFSFYYSQYNKQAYEIKADIYPGKINNEYLLAPIDEFINDGNPDNPDNQVIRHNIEQKKEVRLVNKAIWDFFNEKYGSDVTIRKEPILKKSKYSNTPQKVIEIYNRKFNLIFLPRRRDISKLSMDSKTIYISQSKSLVDLKEKMCHLLKLKNIYSENLVKDNLRLWKINPNANEQEILKSITEIQTEGKDTISVSFLTYLEYLPNLSLEEMELADTDQCVVEYGDDEDPFMFEIKIIDIKNAKCEFCNQKKMLKYSCVCKDVWYCTEMCLERDKTRHSHNCKEKLKMEEGLINETPRSKRGLVGLQNLGNTCFMNTALQCISNCYELTQYFLNDSFKKDINSDNPIGSGGILVRSYAALLKNIWFGESNVFSPWQFKKAISNFQSMFSGYQQHDTQEFLNYLLDGLHEDLNRVIKKPLVEKDDSNKDDYIKSKEQWVGFLKRNQSYLVDIFYGQFKSTLHCPNTECQNVSTTFDPFLSMSLPLIPKTETYEVTTFFIFYDIEIIPVQLNLQFSLETSIMALRNKVSKILNIHPFSFLVVKMDSTGSFEHIVSSSALLKINNNFASREQKPFFLFQIDPKLFYTSANKYYIESSLWKKDYYDIEEYLKQNDEENSKLFNEDYEEIEDDKTYESICYYSKHQFDTINGRKLEVSRINTDDNYGFDNNWLKVVVYLKKYEDMNSRMNHRTRIIFPRIIYINKDWSCSKVHHILFKYFAPIIRSKNNSKLNDEDLWQKYFGDLDTSHINNTVEFHRKNLYPYRLKMKNIFQTRAGNCVWCDRPNCDDCLLPYDDTKIRDLVNKIPNNEDLEIDNTYLYLNDRQKYWSKNWNRDFQLEMVWLNDFTENVKNTLNDKRDFHFKIHSAGGSNSVCIYDCFKNFIKLEKLEENNEWYCPECKNHQKATKKMEIYNAPNVLIIHLKRFSSQRKIDVVVDFPINDLDISNYVINKNDDQPITYDLFAISNHYGSMGFGHYTAFAKNQLDGYWYEFDDSRVSRRSEKDLISNSAYVLFYKRKGLEKLIDIKQLSEKGFMDYSNYKVEDENVEMADK